MKNTLVAYKGGGYDGCWWEWNYFLWNEDGEFENVISTGYKGIKTEDKARELQPGDRSVYFYDLTDPEESMEFVDETAASDVLAVVSRMLQNGNEYEFNGTCYECGEVINVTEMVADNWESDGGVSWNPKDLFCQECANDGV